jgi:putative MATE family efflux protein
LAEIHEKPAEGKTATTSRRDGGLNNMTVGQPWRLILRFALPLLLGNVLQQLYNIVDSIVVGNFVGKTALAAVGTAFPVIFLVNSLFMGIGMGATIIVSQYYGADDQASVKKTIDTIYISLFAVAIPLTVIGLIVARPLLQLMNTPADTLDQATTYMQIIFLGTFASFGYNINSGILQGLGDSKSPLIFLSIATGINIVLDFVFVLGFHWDVAGVAWATILAQLFSFLFGIWYINHRQHYIRISPRHMLFDLQILKDSVRLGLPAGLQNMSFSLGTMVLQSLINSYQSDFMAGFNGANKIDSFAFMPLFTFATAAMTYVGQNIGAGRMDRVKKGVRSTMIMSAIVCLVICVLILLFGGTLMRLFSQEPAVIEAGEAYLIRVAPFYILLAVLFTLNAALRGAGDSVVPLLATLASLWLARVPLAYFLAERFGRDAMFFSFPLGWLVGLAIVVPYYLSGRWRNKSVVRNMNMKET